jgi:hypothetical protein
VIEDAAADDVRIGIVARSDQNVVRQDAQSAHTEGGDVTDDAGKL